MSSSSVGKDLSPSRCLNNVINDGNHDCGKSVTVYCASRTSPGTPEYAVAQRLGYLLAFNGYDVVTGGYCGSMEAVSKGARMAKDEAVREHDNKDDKADNGTKTDVCNKAYGVEIKGMLVPGEFPGRALTGNRYLTSYYNNGASAPVVGGGVIERLANLTSSALSKHYIILPGSLGTLNEFILVWTLSLLDEISEGSNKSYSSPALDNGKDCNDGAVKKKVRRNIICFRNPWQTVINHIVQDLKIVNYEQNLPPLTFVDDPEEALKAVLRNSC